jgi:hypothetical protein
MSIFDEPVIWSGNGSAIPNCQKSVIKYFHWFAGLLFDDKPE